MLWEIVLFFVRSMIMMCNYFDIMEDTAGYGGRKVSPLSGLNRSNDSILLYNHSYTDMYKLSSDELYLSHTQLYRV